MAAFEVVCNGCGASGETDDGTRFNEAVTCAPDSGCCQEPHSHAGDMCDRTVTIWASAELLAQAAQG